MDIDNLTKEQQEIWNTAWDKGWDEGWYSHQLLISKIAFDISQGKVNLYENSENSAANKWKFGGK